MRQEKEIVIGWSLEAALFSLVNNLPLFVVSENEYAIRDFIKKDVSLSKVFIQNSITELTTNHGKMKIGLHKKNFLQLLHFQLALLGNFYKGNITIGDKVTFHGKEGYSQAFNPDKIYVFNCDNVHGLKNIEQESSEWCISDYCYFGQKTEFDLIISGYKKYCQEIWLCDSFDERNTLKKDAVLISFLSEEELYDPDCSDHILRLMGNKIFEDLGIDTKLKYADRHMEKRVKYKTKNYSNVEFRSDSIEDIVTLDLEKNVLEFLKNYYDKES